MLIRPDPQSAVIDPFCKHRTLIIKCDIIDPQTQQGYARDPRSLAKRAEAYLEQTGIADAAYIGSEPEFFVFDDVRFKTDISGSMYHIDAKEAAWNTATLCEGNQGHRPQVKGGYFPVAPVDAGQKLRSDICQHLEHVGICVEAHHHEVATAGQYEIATRYQSLMRQGR